MYTVYTHTHTHTHIYIYIYKLIKSAKDRQVRSPRANGGGQDAQKDLHSRTGWDEKKGKTEEKMEDGKRKYKEIFKCWE